MDAVGAADRGGKLVLEGAPSDGAEKFVYIADQDVGGAHQLHIEAGVEHIRGGHPLMHEARLRPDDLAEMGEKGNDVVLDLALDRIDPRRVEGCVLTFLPDLLCRALRNDPELGHGVRGMRFDLEPDAIARARIPDRRQLRSRVAGNHQVTPSCPASGRAWQGFGLLEGLQCKRPRPYAASPRAKAAAWRMAAIRAP